MAEKRTTDAMTGPQLKRLREDSFKLPQVEMAKLMGLALRTYVRLEGKSYATAPIPMHHAKHVRCLLKSI